ncbi:hypothetical protein TrCOL_g5179 [Triparma columacea]|uniref:Endonuclease/exonuclease/phosphatase domain-containing protein n=1 Tax=Triparma columacea TaxID=722753 RepID=A0A9W7GR63_9STRA|nr:hypothetical protein TrCOL_g5179 [Triparma columacea]
MSDAILAPVDPNDPYITCNDGSGILELVKSVSDSFLASANPLLARNWIQKATFDPKKYEKNDGNDNVGMFRILQFNILAEGLSSVASKSPPLPFNKPSAGGGFDALSDPSSILDYSKRRVRIIEEIIRCSPSLLSLQECDHYHSFFSPVLSKLGYKSTFQPKRSSPCLDFGYYSDGVALFWKESEFELVGEPDNGTDIGDIKVPHCIVKLKALGGCGAPDLIFATTHLKSKSTSSNESVRRSQLSSLCGKVGKIREESGGYKVVLTGDFNTDPVDQPGVRALAFPQVYESLPFLNCAYGVSSSEEEEGEGGGGWGVGGSWSTWKKRGDYEAKHVIDYIFVEESPRDGGNHGLEVGRTWGTPRVEEMKEHRLPCWRYPSDHVSIAAEVYWRTPARGGGGGGGDE